MNKFFAAITASFSTFFSHLGGHLFGPGFNLSAKERRYSILACTALLLWLAWKAWGLVNGWGATDATTVQGGERLLFAANFSARLHVAVPLLGLGLILSWGFFQVLDRTQAGVRLLHWDAKDNESTEAAKTHNGGLIFAALILGIFFVLAQVIR